MILAAWWRSSWTSASILGGLEVACTDIVLDLAQMPFLRIVLRFTNWTDAEVEIMSLRTRLDLDSPQGVVVVHSEAMCRGPVARGSTLVVEIEHGLDGWRARALASTLGTGRATLRLRRVLRSRLGYSIDPEERPLVQVITDASRV